MDGEIEAYQVTLHELEWIGGHETVEYYFDREDAERRLKHYLIYIRAIYPYALANYTEEEWIKDNMRTLPDDQWGRIHRGGSECGDILQISIKGKGTT
jgi:hypothetical protein